MAEWKSARDSMAQGSDEVQDIICESCSNIQITVPAKGFCEDCSEYFCATCCLNHTKFNITRRHRIIDDKDVNFAKEHSKKDVKEIVKFVDRCTSHSDEYIKFFCRYCDEVGCTVCMTTCHMKCGHVDYIPDILNKAEVKREVAETNDEMDKILHDLEDQLKGIEQLQGSIEKCKVKAILDIENERKKINDYFDELEHAAVTEVTEKSKKSLNKVETLRDMHQSVKESIQPCSILLKERLGSEHNLQKFIAAKLAKKSKVIAEEKIKVVNTEMKLKRFAFEPSPGLMAAVKKVTSLGQLVSAETHTRNALKSEHWRLCVYEHPSTGCLVQGIEILSVSHLVANDSFSQSVKMIDIASNKIVSSLALPSSPFDVTSISSTKIAVTIPKLRLIQFISVEENLHLVARDKLNRNKVVRGIQYSKGTLIVSYTDSDTKLEIIDIEGNVLQAFEKGMNGQLWLEKPLYIAVSPDQDVIYVTDIQRNTLTAVGVDGEVKAVTSYKSKMRGMRGIAVDAEGVVYACAALTHNVCQMLGKELRVSPLLDKTDGLYSPQALAYCRQTNRLFVGMMDSACIYVFDIS